MTETSSRRCYSPEEAAALRACGFVGADVNVPHFAGGSYWPDELERRADEAQRLVPKLRLAAAALRREIARDPRTKL